MIIYHGALLLLLFLVSHFCSEKSYNFIFVIATLLTPFSLLIPDLNMVSIFMPYWTDKIFLVLIGFILGIYRLYCLIDSLDSTPRNERAILLVSSFLLINSIEVKLFVLTVLSVYLWLKIYPEKVLVNVKLLVLVFLFFLIKLHGLNYSLHVSIILLCILAVLQLLENTNIYEQLIFLGTLSMVSRRFESDFVAYISFPIFITLSLPYLLDEAKWSTFINFLSRIKPIQKLRIHISWRHGLYLKTPYYEEIKNQQSSELISESRFIEHKSDTLFGIIIILLLIFVALVLV